MPRGLIVKDAPYNVRRSECWLVLCRNQLHGDDFLKWQPISRYGWAVVCLSKRDALECVLYAGGQMHPRPGGPTFLDDDEYERWLLENHFRAERYEPRGKREMTFHEWVNGWVPGYDELRTGTSSPAITYRVYESRFPETPRGVWQQAIHNHVASQ